MTWEQRILRARKAGHFSEVDKRAVGAWPSCAIGEKFHLKKRNIGLNWAGVSKAAENLGLNFMHAVRANDVYGALQIYDQIQLES